MPGARGKGVAMAAVGGKALFRSMAIAAGIPHIFASDASNRHSAANTDYSHRTNVTTYGVPSVIEANKRGQVAPAWINDVIWGSPVGLIVWDRRLSEGPFSPLGYCLLRCHRNHAQGKSKKISKYKFFHRSTLLTATSQVAASNSTP